MPGKIRGQLNRKGLFITILYFFLGMVVVVYLPGCSGAEVKSIAVPTVPPTVIPTNTPTIEPTPTVPPFDPLPIEILPQAPADTFIEPVGDFAIDPNISDIFASQLITRYLNNNTITQDQATAFNTYLFNEKYRMLLIYYKIANNIPQDQYVSFDSEADLKSQMDLFALHNGIFIRQFWNAEIEDKNQLVTLLIKTDTETQKKSILWYGTAGGALNARPDIENPNDIIHFVNFPDAYDIALRWNLDHTQGYVTLIDQTTGAIEAVLNPTSGTAQYDENGSVIQPMYEWQRIGSNLKVADDSRTVNIWNSTDASWKIYLTTDNPVFEGIVASFSEVNGEFFAWTEKHIRPPYVFDSETNTWKPKVTKIGHVCSNSGEGSNSCANIPSYLLEPITEEEAHPMTYNVNGLQLPYPAHEGLSNLGFNDSYNLSKWFFCYVRGQVGSRNNDPNTPFYLIECIDPKGDSMFYVACYDIQGTRTIRIIYQNPDQPQTQITYMNIKQILDTHSNWQIGFQLQTVELQQEKVSKFFETIDGIRDPYTEESDSFGGKTTNFAIPYIIIQ